MIASSGIPTLFAGHDQGDIAMLVADGVTYYCLTFLNRGLWRVESVCFAEQPDGAWSVVFENVVVQLEQADIDQGWILECPRILASGTTFVVHWVQQTGFDEPSGRRELELFRATQDMTAFDATAWSGHLSVDIYYFGLYDAQPVQGHASDFVVTFCAADDQIDVRRYDGYEWADTVWSSSIDGGVFVDFLMGRTVLGIYAHDPDNDVIVSYQDDSGPGGDLMSIHLDADDGGGAVQSVSLDFAASTDDFDATTRYVNVSHERLSANLIGIAAEAQIFVVSQPVDDPLSFIHHVAETQVNSTTAVRVGNQQATANVSLHSRLWSFPNGTAASGSGRDLYAVLGYKSATETNDWRQAYLYPCNLDVGLWQDEQGPADGGEDDNWNSVSPRTTGVRARPISTIYTVGIPDARPAGKSIAGAGVHLRGPARYVNHLSSVAAAPTFGPNVKSRLVALGVWAGLQQASTPDDQTELQPVNAGIGAFRVFMEDPWAVWRESGRTQPIDNFQGAYPRAMCQPAEAGRSLVLMGGTPYIYDGRQVTECGYVYQPEIVAAEAQTMFGVDDLPIPGLSPGIYQAYYVWTRRDKAGQLHRSAPSNVFTIAVSGDNNAVFLRCRPQSMSLFDATVHSQLADAIQLEVYRTCADGADGDGGNNFYREYGAALATLNAVANPSFRARDTPINNANAPYQDIPFGCTDAQVQLQGRGPYQYGADVTAGLVGPFPQPPPAMTVTANWLNRVFGADALDPSVIRYSDEVLPDYGSTYYQGLVWNDSQVFRLGEYGDLMAMQPMNNALIVFTRRGYILSLTAADAGGGLLSINSEVLHEGVVCLDPRSVVLYAHGIGFQSSKGYMLLGRSRELGYGSLTRSRDEPQSNAGAAIEDDIRQMGNLRAATSLESRHQIRLAGNGRPLTIYTSVFTPNVGVGVTGEWELAVAALADPLVFESQDSDLAADIVNGMVPLVQAAIDAGLLLGVIESVADLGNTFSITWSADVVPDYTVSAPPGAAFGGVDTGVLRTQPWSLFYDVLFQQWSRAELPQSNSNTRLAEVVDACSWRGAAGADLHAILTQGALYIERPEGDALEFADQTSTGTVGIPLDITWSWIHLAGMSGYQRTWEIIAQTERMTDAPFFARLEYDRDGSFNGTDLLPTTYEWPRVGSTTPADLRIKPRIQMARSFRLRLYEPPTIGTTENVAIAGLLFHVGAIGGPHRARPSQRGAA